MNMNTAGAITEFDSSGVSLPCGAFLGLARGRLDRPHTITHGIAQKVGWWSGSNSLPALPTSVRSSVAGVLRSLSQAQNPPRVGIRALAARCATFSFDIHTIPIWFGTSSNSIIHSVILLSRATRQAAESALSPKLRTNNNGTGYLVGGLSSSTRLVPVQPREPTLNNKHNHDSQVRLREVRGDTSPRRTNQVHSGWLPVRRLHAVVCPT